MFGQLKDLTGKLHSLFGVNLASYVSQAFSPPQSVAFQVSNTYEDETLQKTMGTETSMQNTDISELKRHRQSPLPGDQGSSLLSSTYEGNSSILAQPLPQLIVTPATHLPTISKHISHLPSPLSTVTDASEPTEEVLLSAVRRGDESKCKLLLSRIPSVNPNHQDEDGRSLLHWAALNGSLSICKLLLDLEIPADCELRDKHGRTPLHCACIGERVDVVQCLLRAGTDIDTVDSDGNTPLHYAATADNVHLVLSLLRKTANPQLRNLEGRIPADLAGPQTIARFKEFSGKPPRSLHGKQPGNCNRIPIRESSQEEVERLMGKGMLKDWESTQKKAGPEDFELMNQLGKGSFGEVFLVKNNERLFAMKVLRKDKIMGQNLVKYAMTERNVLSYIKHPFIVSLAAAFQTADRLFLILDYCSGGDMGWHLSREKRFNEQRARMYASEILLALEELHMRDIIFRDLKPDNVVFDAHGHAMLTDFGLSREGVYDANSAKSFCGSLAYLAPEMLKRRGHGKAVDWYLLGVLIYEMLVGSPPYFTQNREQLFQNILYAPLRLPDTLSVEAKSLIKAVSHYAALAKRPGTETGVGSSQF